MGGTASTAGGGEPRASGPVRPEEEWVLENVLFFDPSKETSQREGGNSTTRQLYQLLPNPLLTCLPALTDSYLAEYAHRTIGASLLQESDFRSFTSTHKQTDKHVGNKQKLMTHFFCCFWLLSAFSFGGVQGAHSQEVYSQPSEAAKSKFPGFLQHSRQTSGVSP